MKVDGGVVRTEPWNGDLLVRGIPFAAPPLGALRWKPPQPVAAWQGVRESRQAAWSCLQNDYGWNHGDFVIGNEDCLTLDVRTPALGGKLPVLVWIHGGSNRAGGPNDIVLSDVGKQVVIVGVRYRLGIFGFLSHREAHRRAGRIGQLRADGSDRGAALGAAQHRHASAAIRATSRSRASPRVRQDVSLLLAAPAARPLFQKAIMESGTPGFGMPFRSLRDAERIGDQADDLLGTGCSLAKMRAALQQRCWRSTINCSHDEDAGRTTSSGCGPQSTVRCFPPVRSNCWSKRRPSRCIIGSNRTNRIFPAGARYRDQFIAKAFGANEPAARAFYKLDSSGSRPRPAARHPRRADRDRRHLPLSGAAHGDHHGRQGRAGVAL